MKLLLLLAALAAPLAATPTRLSVLDNGHLLVPDDWDGALNYALAPNFKDRAYVDVDQGQAMAWAFFDVKLGTLVLWWNNPYEGGPLYSALASAGAPAGLQQQGIGSTLATVPADLFVRVPENKVAMGWAMELGDSLNAALCLRWARGEERRDLSLSGAAGPIGIADSTAAYMNSGGYGNLLASASSNAQFSEGWIFSPQFAWKAEAWTLDGKGDIGFNRLENQHQESLINGADRGELKQTLKDMGLPSFSGTARLRYQVSETGTLVLRGQWGRLQQGLERRLKGSFSGAGLNAAELAGYDHVDRGLDLVSENWEAWAGLVQSGDKARGLLVVALGLQGSRSASQLRQWTPVNTAVSYDSLQLSSQVDESRESLRLPLLLGLEAALKPWLLARSMVQRDLWQRRSLVSETRTLTQRNRQEDSSSVDSGWTFGFGFGLDLGDLVWDMSLQTQWLGASAGTALSQPFLRSTWAYAF